MITEYPNFIYSRVSNEQKAALEKIAARRKLSLSATLREIVADKIASSKRSRKKS